MDISKTIKDTEKPTPGAQDTFSAIQIQQDPSCSVVKTGTGSTSTSIPLKQKVEYHKSTPHLLGIPLEMQRHILSYLLINPILGKAASVSKETGFGSSQKYGLHINILFVCKRLYQEGVLILYGNPIFMDCTNTPGTGEFQYIPQNELMEGRDQGVAGEDNVNTSYEPCIINLCPMSRYTNNKPQEHLQKPPFRNTPAIGRVRVWNVLLSSLNKFWWTTDPFAEFCFSMYSHSDISLNISILPTSFVNDDETWDEEYLDFEDDGLVNNLLPLKMLRNVKSLVFKPAERSSIPEYCYGPLGIPENLSIFSLPSSDLIQEYLKLTSGVAPVVECLKRMVCLLSLYIYTFERAELLVSSKSYPGHYRSIRVYDSSAACDQEIDGVLLYEDSPTKLGVEESYFSAMEMFDAFDNLSLKDSESAEDVVLFKQYRRELLMMLEPQYQRILECSARLREYLKEENGPAGVFVIGPSLAVDQTMYWDRMAKGVRLLEEYEFSFVWSLTEELQSHIRNQNTFIVLKYDYPENDRVMKGLAEAYEGRMWKDFTTYYKQAVKRLEALFSLQRRCRIDLFQLDVLDERGIDLGIQPELVEKITWGEQKWNEQLDLKFSIEVSKDERCSENRGKILQTSEEGTDEATGAAEDDIDE